MWVPPLYDESLLCKMMTDVVADVASMGDLKAVTL